MMTPVLTTLGFVLHPDRRRVLMVHRVARPDDDQLGKYNGLGGKVEPGEDAAAGMCRELREEARIEVDSMHLRGTVSWPGFGRHGEDHFGLIFVIDGWHGEIPDANEEGPLSWERIDGLSELPMWEGDRYFLPLVFDSAVHQFHGCIPYENGRPTGWSVTRL
ncbi:MAG: 8-oxo-dGTP diphosphatase [Acidipropionibacterium acidipropionici]|jgi:8-oxo-dGTP diphosphatase|uniref:7,8-dihydro-8-oxoguanine-triphosphatase n=2 Tax=Acidipropionibacterium acidipropionici TaxID=1748 RepID=A0A142KFY4_9ACTN|nr:8-oxo-dGTP diphosphatase [Acidipropionibacterium acidipropionici]AFV90273.1 Hydrolase, NUDIX family [Acidipropionibacterium acidipropionici ATCC 4875]ALN15473.1 7,8-dihydro-8-oxoguanine-triphosphatase [Acidipropionibacterium acidipropionici]AMS05022.1 7,8-dihydro-8-oxoguanine-triphosphatase [Acidipropionibacterium acidipropionici]AOZ46502.1 7,8-dihydro-8-oxoguanine-triphosphatase [Acidipropionibacterium acidipropionici]APZ08779.1 7,8-dihydro-8-oxoguanine triphosphatase [Acidipropionibacteri